MKARFFPEIKNPEVLKDAIDRYGAPSQIDMAIEEMSELTKALLKNRRNYAAITAGERGRLREAIIEEAADVIVTVAQVIMIYAEPEEIQDAVDFKIDRLRERLEEGNSGAGIGEIVANYCPNCGFAIKWDGIRCLTGTEGSDNHDRAGND